MIKIEKIVKEYSSKKLTEIIEQQYSSYSKSFIDHAKDELIRRGAIFQFNTELEKEVAAMNDNDLKNLVEKEWNNFHLEYLEVARKQYLKRGFKNDISDEEPEPQEESDVKNRYPTLRNIAGIYSVLAWIIGIVGGLFAFHQYSEHDEPGLLIASLVVVALIVLGFLAASESIKLFIDIEKNTRKINE